IVGAVIGPHFESVVGCASAHPASGNLSDIPALPTGARADRLLHRRIRVRRRINADVLRCPIGGHAPDPHGGWAIGGALIEVETQLGAGNARSGRDGAEFEAEVAGDLGLWIIWLDDIAHAEELIV